MQKELYFDISSEQSGGSLYRFSDETGTISFQYHHSTYDDNSGEIKIFQTEYASFTAFWQQMIQNKEWFYLHPLFIHPEQRPFVQVQLKNVNWSLHPGKKWQQSHQRQWKKVLSGPEKYYQKG